MTLQGVAPNAFQQLGFQWDPLAFQIQYDDCPAGFQCDSFQQNAFQSCCATGGTDVEPLWVKENRYQQNRQHAGFGDHVSQGRVLRWPP